MEKKVERVLAFHMAKVISKEELAAVSGGGIHKCTKPCGGASGGSGQSGEVHLDITWDFDL